MPLTTRETFGDEVNALLVASAVAGVSNFANVAMKPGKIRKREVAAGVLATSLLAAFVGGIMLSYYTIDVIAFVSAATAIGFVGPSGWDVIVRAIRKIAADKLKEAGTTEGSISERSKNVPDGEL